MLQFFFYCSLLAQHRTMYHFYSRKDCSKLSSYIKTLANKKTKVVEHFHCCHLCAKKQVLSVSFFEFDTLFLFKILRFVWAEHIISSIR